MCIGLKESLQSLPLVRWSTDTLNRVTIPFSIEYKIVHSLKFPYLCTCRYFQLLDMKPLARNKHVINLNLLVNDMPFFIKHLKLSITIAITISIG